MGSASSSVFSLLLGAVLLGEGRNGFLVAAALPLFNMNLLRLAPHPSLCLAHLLVATTFLNIAQCSHSEYFFYTVRQQWRPNEDLVGLKVF